jgi:hypothetical protein
MAPLAWHIPERDNRVKVGEVIDLDKFSEWG